MNFNDGNNGWRLSNRKTVQTLVILTILAWATQTLLRQWGYGQELSPEQQSAQQLAVNSAANADVNAAVDVSAMNADSAADPAPASNTNPADPAGDNGAAPLGAGTATAMPTEPQAPGAERFVPGDAGVEPVVGTLELRSEATVNGDTVTLKGLCRWSNADAAAFAPIADLIIVRLSQTVPFKSVGVDDIRQTLHDAGVNVAMIDFVGSSSCTVSREDVQVDEGQALQDWIAARQSGVASNVPPAADTEAPPPAGAAAAAIIETAAPAADAPAATSPTATDAAPSSDHPQTLRDQLISDAATRFNLPADALQIAFNPADEKLLSLSAPLFRFNLTAQRLLDLGSISWNVEIVTDTGSRNVTIAATARAWQTQLIVNKPLAYKQVIQPDDVQVRRTLIDHLPSDTVLTLPQAVGQEASGDIKPGVVLTARMVDPVPLCKTGELITVTVTQGGVHLRMVARAMESGAFGQTIHARNEMDQDVLEVVMTGPDEARLGPDSTSAAAN